MLTTPFHTVIDMDSWEDMSALIPAEKLNGEDMCFAATFINEGGVESHYQKPVVYRIWSGTLKESV